MVSISDKRRKDLRGVLPGYSTKSAPQGINRNSDSSRVQQNFVQRNFKMDADVNNFADDTTLSLE